MNIVLVEPEIPPNTGNVARLCAATNTTLHLIEPFGFKLDDTQLKRAGMDYWQHVEWHRWPDWKAFEESSRRTRGFGSSSPADRRFTATRNFQRTIIWFSGARPPVCRSSCWNQTATAGCGFRCSTQKSRSLNLSNCVALVLFEALRQQGFKGGV